MSLCYKLQTGAALLYYILGQTLLQIGAASLLQTRASTVTNWGSYYILGQPLLLNRAAITNWRKMYYKLGQVLQIRAIITNWGITHVHNQAGFDNPFINGRGFIHVGILKMNFTV